jgi:hypothetical protein
VRARIENQVLLLHNDDVPQYKKKGSVVRNTYFWALRAIAGNAPYGGDWEYESEVWLALQRVLVSFAESGYLGMWETTLEFSPEQGEIPAVFRYVATWERPSEDRLDEEESLA